ncbi:NAD-dependent DNA ligase LigA [Sesbania bispinosa]|nr:NAD-dependent DNA ligase LigA [Sesbania bispinosa]
MTSAVAGMVSTLAGIPIPIPRAGSSRTRNVPPPTHENRVSSPTPNQLSREDLLDFIRRQEKC